MWRRDDTALELLELRGPFEQRAFRQAAIATMTGFRDVSFGAVAPDGTRAAISLAVQRLTAHSFPPSVYGGIIATRHLNDRETAAFLAAARKASRLHRLVARWPLLDDAEAPSSARCVGVADVVYLRPETPPAARYSRLARRSIRKAQRAGCTMDVDAGVEAFLRLYERAATRWAQRYSSDLIRDVDQRGIAVRDIVSMNGEPVAGLLTMLGAAHWMCWLAAQNSEGRSAAASYLAYDTLLDRAWKAGVSTVSFGSSAAGTGGAQFKHYLGAVQVPIYELVDAPTPIQVAVDALRAAAARIHSEEVWLGSLCDRR